MTRVVLIVVTATVVFLARPESSDACGVKVSARAPGVKRVMIARRAADKPTRTLTARRPIRVGPVARSEARRAPIATGSGTRASGRSVSAAADTSEPKDTAVAADTTADTTADKPDSGDRVAMTETKAEDTRTEPETEEPAVPSRKSGRFRDLVFFKNSSAELIRPARSKLLRRALWLKRHRGLNVVVEGHTNTTGPAAANQALSEARANAVKDFLVDHGVKEDRIEVSAFGMTRPAFKPGENPRNRRTVVVPVKK
jgi:outer membrane protein OmpA-like peptidoglycan-associated protein